jgi:hypothetical protein
MTISAHGAAAGHGTHLLMTLGPMAVIAFAATLADLRRRFESPAVPATLWVAVVLSLAAALIHFAAGPEHFEESAQYGAFFVACAVAQLAWPAVAVLRPSRWMLWAGAAGNLAVAGLWLWTRTVGIPLGPERGVVEAVAPMDLLASLTEIGVMMLCGWILTDGTRRVVSTQPTAV